MIRIIFRARLILTLYSDTAHFVQMALFKGRVSEASVICHFFPTVKMAVKIKITPTHLRLFPRARRHREFAPQLKANNAGSVPNQKAKRSEAPNQNDCATEAISTNPYNQPHGKRPVKKPVAAARQCMGHFKTMGNRRWLTFAKKRPTPLPPENPSLVIICQPKRTSINETAIVAAKENHHTN